VQFLIDLRVRASQFGSVYRSLLLMHYAVLLLVSYIVSITHFSAQVADMHFAQGAQSQCFDVSTSHHCSDLNTTSFIERLLAAEKPDLVVFTGMLWCIPDHCPIVEVFELITNNLYSPCYKYASDRCCVCLIFVDAC